jgi:hypothetical protein
MLLKKIVFFGVLTSICYASWNNTVLDQNKYYTVDIYQKQNAIGNVIITWISYSTGNSLILKASYYAPGVGFSTEQLSSSVFKISNIKSVLLDNGKALVVWDEQENEHSSRVVKASIYNGSEWSTPENLSGTILCMKELVIAFNENDIAVVAWIQEEPKDVFNVRVSRHNGSWSTSTLDYSATMYDRFSNLFLDLNSANDITIAWRSRIASSGLYTTKTARWAP